MTLKQSAFSAIRWTSLAMVIGTLLQFTQMVVLARLLTPSDFGLMAVVLAVMTFVRVFTDLGVSNAIIHYQDINQQQLSSLFWLNVLVGLGLMLIMAAGSYSISNYLFHEPRLEPILIMMSVSILLTALGQQLRIMAEKSLRFPIIAIIEIVSVLLGAITAISWAWFSPTVYALVAGLIVNEGVKSLLLWCYARDGWWPSWWFKLSEIMHFLRFGAYIMANNFVNSINQQADIFIAGRLVPLDNLGLYSLPRTLSLKVAGVINPVVTRVGLPIMAKAQHEPERLKTVYLKTMQMTASINSPIYLGLAFFSEDVVQLMFGEQWVESAPLLMILAVWGLFRSFGNPVGSLLLAVGRADLSFKWNLSLIIVMLPSLWLAAQWGVNGLALGQTILMILLMLPGWYFLVRPNCDASILEYLRSLLTPLACAIPAFFLGDYVADGISEPLYRIALATMISLSVYLAFSAMFNREWLLAMWQLVTRR